MPGRYADSSCGFARKNVAERPLSAMSKHFYDSAKSRFWGAGFAGAGHSSAKCSGTNKSTQTAGVPLRTGKTGCRSDGNCRCARQTICYEPNRLETTRGGIAGIETVGNETTWDFAERENKITRTAVRSCSPT
jgi:hypothetical protein